MRDTVCCRGVCSSAAGILQHNVMNEIRPADMMIEIDSWSTGDSWEFKPFPLLFAAGCQACISSQMHLVNS